MRKLFIGLFVSIVLLLTTSSLSSNKYSYLFDIERDTLRLPLHQARGADVDDLFETIKYIPLEQSSNSIIQEVQDLWVTEQYIIVFDRRGKAILMFDRSGKFKHKIDKVPHCNSCNRGSILFGNVFINRSKQLIYASYGTSMNNAAVGVFQFDGKFVEEKKEWISVDGMGFLAGLIFLNNSTYLNPDKEKLQLFKDGDYTTLIRKQPLAKEDYVSTNNMFSKIDSEGRLLYVSAYQNTLYTLTEDGITRETDLIFPYENSLPKAIWTDARGKYYEVLSKRHPNAVFSLENPIFHKNRLFLTLLTVNVSDNLSALMYDNKTGSLYDLKKVRSGRSNQFLPISSDNSSNFFMDADSDLLYSYITRSDVTSLFIRNPSFSKEVGLSAFTKELLNPKSKITNPILVISRLR